MISVIIPTYNSAQYICDAVDSVLCQTYTDYEVIIIDDGSTDDTKTKITERYPAVKYLQIEHAGVASARNYGILMAQGEFIAFLDADDIWLPEKLEKQSALFHNNNRLGLVFTENYFFDKDGIIENNVNKRERLMHGDIVRNIFLNSYVVTSTVMVPKRVFDTVGLFEEGLTVAEDDNMWMRIGMIFDLELLDEPAIMYRITEGSLSRKKHNISKGVRSHIEMLKKKYPDLYYRVGQSAIRKKYSELFFSEGYECFTQHKYREARSNFVKSNLYYPLQLKPFLYIISTCLPPRVIENVRTMKRRLEK